MLTWMPNLIFAAIAACLIIWPGAAHVVLQQMARLSGRNPAQSNARHSFIRLLGAMLMMFSVWLAIEYR